MFLNLWEHYASGLCIELTTLNMACVGRCLGMLEVMNEGLYASSDFLPQRLDASDIPPQVRAGAPERFDASVL
jgi:hypothetical protein